RAVPGAGAGFAGHPGQHGLDPVPPGPGRGGAGLPATGLGGGQGRRDRRPPGRGAVVAGAARRGAGDLGPWPRPGPGQPRPPARLPDVPAVSGPLRTATVLLGLLLLSACATRPARGPAGDEAALLAAQSAREAALAEQPAWQLSGRLAVSVDG